MTTSYFDKAGINYDSNFQLQEPLLLDIIHMLCKNIIITKEKKTLKQPERKCL